MANDHRDYSHVIGGFPLVSSAASLYIVSSFVCVIDQKVALSIEHQGLPFTFGVLVRSGDVLSAVSVNTFGADVLSHTPLVLSDLSQRTHLWLVWLGLWSTIVFGSRSSGTFFCWPSRWIIQWTTSALTSANMNGVSYLMFRSPSLMALTGHGPHWYSPEEQNLF